MWGPGFHRCGTHIAVPRGRKQRQNTAVYTDQNGRIVGGGVTPAQVVLTVP